MASRVALYEQVDNRNERLVLDHMPMVKRVAVHLRGRIPPFMELEELVQVGMVGLIEAARAYDPGRGIDFENFALSRIRGAMLDEVRRLSALPRSAVAFNQSQGGAASALATELGRKPSAGELADYLGKEIEQFHRERDSAHRFETLPIDTVSDEAMAIADESSRQPEAIVEQAQFMRALQAAIDGLSERERLVMQLYYVEELNLKEIGATIGVTESRVSQILSGNVRTLRRQLGMS
jgi:RNA polymerase sigma factor for flagellar operon FliA